MKRRGRKSAAQTPAPKSDKIYGSKTNPEGSASSRKSAKSIELSDKIIDSLKEKLEEFKKSHEKDITLNDLKAVYRRGLGAYSSSHRPTITGGVPNSRNAWAMARVNKFLKKAGGEKVKAAYVQDDDLMAEGGKVWNDKELLKKYNSGESIGFTGIAHLKAQGLIKRADGTKRKSMAEGGLLAPNGKKSNLTAEQYKLVRTPEFKAWFGDWENDPENSSKIIDKNGEPLIVYHGTNQKFTIFSLEKVGSNVDYGMWGSGFYFSPVKSISKSYGSNLLKLFLNIRNPFVRNPNLTGSKTQFKPVFGKEESIKLREQILGVNYDGVLQYEAGQKNTLFQIIAFHPEQIKLADGTNTTFDGSNPDIRYEDGGNTAKNAEGGEEVTCVNCGWKWNTSQSDESDKYVCHQCGFDNTLYYTNEIMSKLKQPKTLEEIAKIHNITTVEGAERLTKQLEKGIKAEMEHTTDENIAKTIALHHIEEIPDYYDRLEIMEKDQSVVQSHNDYNLGEYVYWGSSGKKYIVTNNQIARGKYIQISPVGEDKYFQVSPDEVVPAEDKTIETTDKLKDGGVVVGKRHSESDENGTGERFLVKSTGQVVELEGGEGVLNKESMQSNKIFMFEGEKMTPREIASFLNHKYGGVEFAKGGEVHHVCGCKSKFYHGGELPSATLDSLEGGEAVVTVKTMESKDKYNYNGKQMTPREILSNINYQFGGKRFEEGGTIDLSKHRMNNQIKLGKMVFFVQKVLYSQK